MDRERVARSNGALWIFGYGSLLWRPDFPYVERRIGWVEGWSRRFWQGSTDHRGEPHAPGRVVTVVRDSGGRCWGVVYRIKASARASVLAALDHRERGGFERIDAAVRLAPDGAATIRATMYVASVDNPNYLGPAEAEDVADQIRRSRGPSGANTEYLHRLADALRAIGADDPHVFDLESRLAARARVDDAT